MVSSDIMILYYKQLLIVSCRLSDVAKKTVKKPEQATKSKTFLELEFAHRTTTVT